MRKPLSFLMLLTPAVFAGSFGKPVAVPLDKLPSLTLQAKPVAALRYRDAAGENLVILAETGERQVPGGEDGTREAELWAVRYVGEGTERKVAWKVHDQVKDCPVDLVARFESKEFQVTDLDRDDTAEVWMPYTTTCSGDPSPMTRKVIVYEGSRKLAMRGTSQSSYGDGKPVGGEWTFDEAFKAAPPEFRTHAVSLWKRLVEVDAKAWKSNYQ